MHGNFKENFPGRGDAYFECCHKLPTGKDLRVSGCCSEILPILQLDNSRCLAQKGGCFACIDHCPKEAVNIALGVGIAIDADLCDGCGECALVCPTSPNVIAMKPKSAE